MNTPLPRSLPGSPLPLVPEISEPGAGVSPRAKHAASRRSPAKLAALLALAALSAAGAPAFGQAILENYGRTLTAYSADSDTPVGKVWPLDLNRGVHVDGAMRMGSAQPWAFAGNPFGEGWDGNNRLGDIRLDAGSFNPTDVDLSLPAPGFRWVVGRSFNGRQFDGGSFITSDGPQGKNWMQLSQPEIVQGSGSTGADDVIYIVYGADRYLEFQRTGTTSDIYKGKNGAAGLIKHTAGAVNNVLNPADDVCELYEYYDQNGVVTTFFGSVGCLSNAWQIWKITDPAGNVAYVGDLSSDLAARSAGYASGGRILLAYDSADRRYTYTYTTISGTSRLTQVKVETKASGTWASPSGVVTVGQVDYAYYTADSTDIGLIGDLKMVTITTPLTDSGVNLVQKKHYRYYTQSWNNADGQRGDPHQIKMVLGFEGARNFDWTGDTTLDDDFLTVTAANEGDLKPYAEAYLEYITASDTDHPLKVSKVFTLGQCGCGGGSGTGTYSLTYDESATHDTDRADTTYDTAWAMRAVIEQPDGTYITQYFDETGQPLSRVVTDTDPASYTDLWATYVARNSDGQVTAIHSPAQIGSGYTHNSGGPPTPDGSFTTSGGSGLITVFNRVSSGDMEGLPEAFLHKDGNSGTAYFDSWTEYTSRSLSVAGATGSGTVVRPFVELRYVHHTQTSTYSTANTYDETIVLDTGTAAWWSGTSTNVLYLAPKKLVTSHPVVSTGKNGSNAATTTERFIRTDGTTAFTKNQEGIYSYSKFTKGQVVMSIEDVKTNDATDIDVGNDDPNGVFGITETGDGFHRKTTYAYDAQGRSDTTTMPDGDVAKNYYSKVGDGRMVSISLPPYSSSTTVWYGPASYSVSNHAGKPELHCTLAIAGGGINTATGGKALTDWVTEATLTYDYGTSNGIDDRLSRVKNFKNGGTTWATYQYGGTGWLVGTALNEPSTYSYLYDVAGGTNNFDNLDRFNRTTTSTWIHDFPSVTDRAIYDVDISYDANSNITQTIENIQLNGNGDHAFDALYTIDGLNRVTAAEEGKVVASAIASGYEQRREQWSLDQIGNFTNAKRNLNWNADTDYTDANEFDDTQTHSNANEIKTRNVDSSGGVEYTHAYDLTGNLTDDNWQYKFTYDVRGRLRKIKNQSNALVAEYTYNGLGYRIGWHYDSTRSGGGPPDGTVDGNDPWFWFAHDERWRQVASYRNTDSDPKERMVYHVSGLGGYGGSSYIDSVMRRDWDYNGGGGWTGASDGVLEAGLYYGQNWRQDISVTFGTNGQISEWVKYLSYGTPFGIPFGDTDADGDVDNNDGVNIGGYDIRMDLDMDGDVDSTDSAMVMAAPNDTMAFAVLSKSSVNNRKGYAGYENGFDVGRFSHVRHRVLDSTLGRWTKRDPLGYVDSPSTYAYITFHTLGTSDPSGLSPSSCELCIAAVAIIVSYLAADISAACNTITVVTIPLPGGVAIAISCRVFQAIAWAIAAAGSVLSAPVLCRMLGFCDSTYEPPRDSTNPGPRPTLPISPIPDFKKPREGCGWPTETDYRIPPFSNTTDPLYNPGHQPAIPGIEHNPNDRFQDFSCNLCDIQLSRNLMICGLCSPTPGSQKTCEEAVNGHYKRCKSVCRKDGWLTPPSQNPTSTTPRSRIRAYANN